MLYQCVEMLVLSDLMFDCRVSGSLIDSAMEKGQMGKPLYFEECWTPFSTLAGLDFRLSYSVTSYRLTELYLDRIEYRRSTVGDALPEPPGSGNWVDRTTFKPYGCAIH